MIQPFRTIGVSKMIKPTLRLLAISCILTFIGSSYAEEMDVDLSDTLDFDEFHKDKKSAVKLWEDKDEKVAKTYEETDKVSNDKSAADAAPQPAPTDTVDKKGKRYEIRELYSISGSERTGYNPSTVTQALFLQMQGYCPKGWRKLDERSEPDGTDAFYMYYAFECL